VKRHITKTEVKAFKARWKVVNAAERDELRKTSVEQKFKQLAALMRSAKKLGWTKALAAEEADVRGRWNRLRKIWGSNDL
jgi:hypothetical protein